MNIAPTNAAMPTQRISHSRLLSGNFLLRRLRMKDGLCFLLYATNACRINQFITVKIPQCRTQTCHALGISRLSSDFKVQRRESKLVLVLSVDVSDGGISLLQLSLAQFDDRP
jgi:hypothetical protein